jgi:hypothetical protein
MIHSFEYANDHRSVSIIVHANMIFQRSEVHEVLSEIVISECNIANRRVCQKNWDSPSICTPGFFLTSIQIPKYEVLCVKCGILPDSSLSPVAEEARASFTLSCRVSRLNIEACRLTFSRRRFTSTSSCNSSWILSVGCALTRSQFQKHENHSEILNRCPICWNTKRLLDH